ncbi:hypothetical protein C5167_003824 [Papaver somniferum]|uniref:Uncharacterized protein n=1 Tax=Papaver somniferum TaxID=3469 RepID=A0A4Y7L588_PAPSO|nr:hypothetical protein C5167_003824 [Papaver somniferum]
MRRKRMNHIKFLEHNLLKKEDEPYLVLVVEEQVQVLEEDLDLVVVQDNVPEEDEEAIVIGWCYWSRFVRGFEVSYGVFEYQEGGALYHRATTLGWQVRLVMAELMLVENIAG